MKKSAAPVASRRAGKNILFYNTLHEAFVSSAAVKSSLNCPDEITLLADVIIDEPLIMLEGVHIRLIPGDENRVIRRGAKFIEFPVLWLKEENSSLTLGKHGMRLELIIDGGYLNDTPIIALSSLIAVNGKNSKLIMYDNVIIQNNYNNAAPIGINTYQNGSGVIVRSFDEYDLKNQAEFIMKGGTIQGNSNFVKTPLAVGGGVLITGIGIFRMEGGDIMNNTARCSGGGFHTGARGSFYKTGGIIYGSDAPVGFRNTAVNGSMIPKTWPVSYGHAVCAAAVDPQFYFRNDTVSENDNLSFTGTQDIEGHLLGKDDKWDNSGSVTPFSIMPSNNPKIDLSVYKLSPRETEICNLLLTTLSPKEVAFNLNLTYSGTYFHIQNLYRKLGVGNREELFVKLTAKE